MQWGFFSNFYNISKHNDGDEFAGVPHARMDGYNQSELYAGAQESHHKDLRRICNNEKRHCFADLHLSLSVTGRHEEANKGCSAGLSCTLYEST